jgi:hypothetical protein
MIRLSFALPLLAASAAFAAEPARTMSPQEVPAGLAPAVARGEAAIDALQERIFKRLNALLVHAGPAGAVDPCRTDAPRIAKELGELHQVDLGRTSFRVRNPSNAPRKWAAAFVAAASGKRFDEVKPVVIDLGDRVGLLRPIAATPACVRCHGPVGAMEPAVKAEIARRYPRDRATGFAAGDLRGFVWVEVKKR